MPINGSAGGSGASHARGLNGKHPHSRYGRRAQQTRPHRAQHDGSGRERAEFSRIVASKNTECTLPGVDTSGTLRAGSELVGPHLSRYDNRVGGNPRAGPRTPTVPHASGERYRPQVIFLNQSSPGKTYLIKFRNPKEICADRQAHRLLKNSEGANR